MVPKFISLVNRDDMYGIVGEQYDWVFGIEYDLTLIQLYDRDLRDIRNGQDPIKDVFFGPTSVGWPIIS